jgi:hypothetical protein
MRFSSTSSPRPRFLSSVAALAGLSLLFALTGCGSIPFIGAGSFDLAIDGEPPVEIESLFVIVADEADLTDSDSPHTIGNLVRPDRHGKYRTFGQFKPIANATGDGWLWETRNIKPAHPAIVFTPSEEALKLGVVFGREVFETHPQTCLVIICHYGGKEWKVEKLLGPELENSSELTVEIRSRVMVRKAEQ